MSDQTREEKKKPVIYLNDQTSVEISRKSPFLRDINLRLYLYTFCTSYPVYL